ncbi:unnamed protein product [Dibothriocephalus latus]|uniref:Fibronectin type-III domain-containing protein n=1 Tax=Dibothriocephalus latus TaxID=60516 RepID=A0A3P6T5W2_DIBLA|nr:unnamed protein product [Dibothriocephalus latus]
MTLLPPRNVQVELNDRRRLDYRVTWLPPALSLNAVQDNALTRYRVMWAPRQEEPVDATTYNDKAGFSPILDTARSDVRVVEKNQTWIILPRLRPKTFYILRIQTIGSVGRGREKESTPVVHYFMTHDAFHTDRRISPQLQSLEHFSLLSMNARLIRWPGSGAGPRSLFRSQLPIELGHIPVSKANVIIDITHPKRTYLRGQEKGQ